MRDVKTLMVNISICKYLNLGDISTKLQQNIPIKLNVSIIYLNKFATDLFLTHAEHSESTSLQVFNLTFACILINIFCICLLFAYLSHFIVYLMYLHFFKKIPERWRQWFSFCLQTSSACSEINKQKGNGGDFYDMIINLIITIIIMVIMRKKLWS